MEVVKLVQELWPVAAGVGGGLAAWAKWRSDMRKFKREEEAARQQHQQQLIVIAQKAAADVIQGLREEIARLRKEVDALERELNSARREHAETVAAKDAKIMLMEGELRQKEAIIDKLERFIRDQGLEVPTPKARHYYAVPSGDGPAPVEPL